VSNGSMLRIGSSGHLVFAGGFSSSTGGAISLTSQSSLILHSVALTLNEAQRSALLHSYRPHKTYLLSFE
jgi:hypothetical protein